MAIPESRWSGYPSPWVMTKVPITLRTAERGMAFRLFPNDDVGPGAEVRLTDGVTMTYDHAHEVKGFGGEGTWTLGANFLLGSTGGLGIALIADWLIDRLGGSDVEKVDIGNRRSVPLAKADLVEALREALAQAEVPVQPVPKGKSPQPKPRRLGREEPTEPPTPKHRRKKRK